MEIEKLVKQNLSLYNKEEKEEYFYKHRDGSYFPYFKKDIQSCINDLYPESIIKILKIMNYPFWEDEYYIKVNHEIKKAIRTGYPYNSPLGKYIAFFNLRTMKNYTFEDSKYDRNIKYYDIDIVKINKRGDEE